MQMLAYYFKTIHICSLQHKLHTRQLHSQNNSLHHHNLFRGMELHVVFCDIISRFRLRVSCNFIGKDFSCEVSLLYI